MNNQVCVYTDQQKELIKNLCCKGSTDEEFSMFLHVCSRVKLDPFARQIYAVKRMNYKTGKEDITIQTGIDGYRLIAERTGKYSPGREPSFRYDDKGRLVSATSYVMKMTDDGKWHEVAATAFWSEYVQTRKGGEPTQFWMKMGHTMISKCAEALALRKAFPGDLSGVYTKEEMQQADLEDADVSIIEPQKLIEETKEEIPVVEYMTTGDLQQIHLLLSGDEDYKKKLLDHYQVSDLKEIPRKKCSTIIKSLVHHNKKKKELVGV